MLKSSKIKILGKTWTFFQPNKFKISLIVYFLLFLRNRNNKSDKIYSTMGNDRWEIYGSVEDDLKCEFKATTFSMHSHAFSASLQKSL